jgi:hypothetical protein
VRLLRCPRAQLKFGRLVTIKSDVDKINALWVVDISLPMQVAEVFKQINETYKSAQEVAQYCSVSCVLVGR